MQACLSWREISLVFVNCSQHLATTFSKTKILRYLSRSLKLQDFLPKRAQSFLNYYFFPTSIYSYFMKYELVFAIESKFFYTRSSRLSKIEQMRARLAAFEQEPKWLHGMSVEFLPKCFPQSGILCLCEKRTGWRISHATINDSFHDTINDSFHDTIKDSIHGIIKDSIHGIINY